MAPEQPTFVDLSGQRFGRLVAVSYERKRCGNDARLRTLYTCRCDCGRMLPVFSDNLPRGNTTSCGCRRSEVSETRQLKHAHARKRAVTPEYRCWRHMISRCEGKGPRSVKAYFERGIRVCAEWRHDFAAFLAHVGPRPSPRHSIDRIDNDGNYEPGNVRWATRETQSANRQHARARRK